MQFIEKVERPTVYISDAGIFTYIHYTNIYHIISNRLMISNSAVYYSFVYNLIRLSVVVQLYSLLYDDVSSLLKVVNFLGQEKCKSWLRL